VLVLTAVAKDEYYTESRISIDKLVENTDRCAVTASIWHDAVHYVNRRCESTNVWSLSCIVSMCTRLGVDCRTGSSGKILWKLRVADDSE
jgi:hypothetical protein